MWTNLKSILGIANLVISSFKSLKKLYKDWQISRVRKAVKERKEELNRSVNDIIIEAAKEESDESDEKLKDLYRKLYKLNS